MLVTLAGFDETLSLLKTKNVLSLDCETSGLRPYHGDRLFALILADDSSEYYLNFHPEHPECLTALHLSLMQIELFSDPDKTYIMHNAKFDMAFLANEGCFVAGTVHDTKAVARVLQSDRKSLSLEACAADIGLEKSKAVDNYIKEHKLTEKVLVPGKNKRITLKHFKKVPPDIIIPYGEKDGRITYDLYRDQRARVRATELPENLAPGWVPLTAVYENERALTKVLFDMEQTGVQIDKLFCERAIEHENARRQKSLEAFKEQTGEAFKNSPLLFKKVFAGEKFVFGKPTKKKFQVNPKFDSDTLATFKHPAAKSVVELRDAKSKADYYQGFLWQADSSGVIHCNFNQDGAATGRFSSSEPNLQNLTKSEDSALDEEFVVRRAIIPKSGKLFVMLDYNQVEYRLLLDYLGARKLIEQVLDGLDVHTATANIAGVTRSSAKTVNFATIYGSGLRRLAATLGTTEAEACHIQQSIFAAIPTLQPFIASVQAAAEKRRFVRNWLGRRCNFPPGAKLHRAVNHLIQGGCADVVKMAMVRVHGFLKPYQTKMVLNVHDEIILECVPQELHLLPEVKTIMESVYQPRHGLPLSCSVAYSYKSLADKTEGFPDGKTARNGV